MKLRLSKTLPAAAAQAAISVASAYRIEHDPQLPSAKNAPRERRRPDPLASVFDAEVVPLLEVAPGIRPVAVFDELRRRHAELDPGVRRTLKRRIRALRALHGQDRDVMFRQVHEAGRMGLSDFTEMRDLGVTTLGVALDHRRLPDLNALLVRFAPDPARLPEVTVRLAPLSSYDVVMASTTEVMA